MSRAPKLAETMEYRSTDKGGREIWVRCMAVQIEPARFLAAVIKAPSVQYWFALAMMDDTWRYVT